MPEAEFRIPRTTPRFSFIAEAEVSWPKDQTRVVARISELSSRGCYVDTVSPFPMDTELHFLIRGARQGHLYAFRLRYGCAVWRDCGYSSRHTQRLAGRTRPEIGLTHVLTRLNAEVASAGFRSTRLELLSD